MKTLFTILILLFCYSAFGQDTLSHVEFIKGKQVIIREIIHENFIQHDLPRIITMVLAVVSVIVFIFFKPKSKADENSKKTA